MSIKEPQPSVQSHFLDSTFAIRPLSVSTYRTSDKHRNCLRWDHRAAFRLSQNPRATLAVPRDLVGSHQPFWISSDLIDDWSSLNIVGSQSLWAAIAVGKFPVAKFSWCQWSNPEAFGTRMWNMISSPATPTVCLEQKSENFQSRNVKLSMPSPSRK